MPAEVPRVSIHGDAVRNAPHGDDHVDDAVVISDIDESGSGCRHCPGEEEYRDVNVPDGKTPRYPPAADGPSLSLPKMYSIGRRIHRVPIETTYMKHVRSVWMDTPAPHPSIRFLRLNRH